VELRRRARCAGAHPTSDRTQRQAAPNALRDLASASSANSDCIAQGSVPFEAHVLMQLPRQRMVQAVRSSRCASAAGCVSLHRTSPVSMSTPLADATHSILEVVSGLHTSSVFFAMRRIMVAAHLDEVLDPCVAPMRSRPRQLFLLSTLLRQSHCELWQCWLPKWSLHRSQGVSQASG